MSRRLYALWPLSIVALATLLGVALGQVRTPALLPEERIEIASPPTRPEPEKSPPPASKPTAADSAAPLIATCRFLARILLQDDLGFPVTGLRRQDLGLARFFCVNSDNETLWEIWCDVSAAGDCRPLVEDSPAEYLKRTDLRWFAQISTSRPIPRARDQFNGWSEWSPRRESFVARREIAAPRVDDHACDFGETVFSISDLLGEHGRIYSGKVHHASGTSLDGIANLFMHIGGWSIDLEISANAFNFVANEFPSQFEGKCGLSRAAAFEAASAEDLRPAFDGKRTYDFGTIEVLGGLCSASIAGWISEDEAADWGLSTTEASTFNAPVNLYLSNSSASAEFTVQSSTALVCVPSGQSTLGVRFEEPCPLLVSSEMEKKFDEGILTRVELSMGRGDCVLVRARTNADVVPSLEYGSVSTDASASGTLFLPGFVARTANMKLRFKLAHYQPEEVEVGAARLIEVVFDQPKSLYTGRIQVDFPTFDFFPDFPVGLQISLSGTGYNDGHDLGQLRLTDRFYLFEEVPPGQYEVVIKQGLRNYGYADGIVVPAFTVVSVAGQLTKLDCPAPSPPPIKVAISGYISKITLDGEPYNGPLPLTDASGAVVWANLEFGNIVRVSDAAQLSIFDGTSSIPLSLELPSESGKSAYIVNDLSKRLLVHCGEQKCNLAFRTNDNRYLFWAYVETGERAFWLPQGEYTLAMNAGSFAKCILPLSISAGRCAEASFTTKLTSLSFEYKGNSAEYSGNWVVRCLGSGEEDHVYLPASEALALSEGEYELIAPGTFKPAPPVRFKVSGASAMTVEIPAPEPQELTGSLRLPLTGSEDEEEPYAMMCAWYPVEPPFQSSSKLIRSTQCSCTVLEKGKLLVEDLPLNTDFYLMLVLEVGNTPMAALIKTRLHAIGAVECSVDWVPATRANDEVLTWIRLENGAQLLLPQSSWVWNGDYKVTGATGTGRAEVTFKVETGSDWWYEPPSEVITELKKQGVHFQQDRYR